MRITAHNGHSRLGNTKLRADDVNDALISISERVNADTKFLCVIAQGINLQFRDWIGNGLINIQRWNIVIFRRQSQIRAADFSAGKTQAIECLWASYLMNQVEVDIQQIGFTRCAANHVIIPNLLCQCLTHFNAALSSPQERKFASHLLRCQY